MAIIRFNPYLQSFFKPLSWDEDDYSQMTMTEGLNLWEENGNVVVEAAVPGVPEEKIDITYEDGVLTISAKQEEMEEERKRNRIVHKMQRVSSFNYTTYLPRAIDEKKMEAVVKDGILTITAPVAEAAKAKKIQVKRTAK